MPRIMLTNGTLYGGGAEHVIATLARQLRAAGHSVLIAIIHRGLEVRRELEREGFDVVSEIASGARGLQTSTRLRELARERGINVVHSHDLRSLIDVGLSRLRSKDFAHIHTFHFGNYPFVSRKHLLMEGLFARIPDRLIAVGNVQKRSIESALRIPKDRIRTIWNGVDYSAAAGADTNGDAAVPLIGSVSTFGEQKGLPTLLEAARLLRDRGLRFRLMMVGEGPLRAGLEAETKRLGLSDCIEYTGWRADAAKALLPTFDIFVQSSYWEAMSVVILEAMAAQKAIVATRVGENGDVLEHGKSAILVEPRNAQSLADGLARVIEDAGFRKRLATAARQSYATSFTGAAMAQRYAAAYTDLLTARRLH